MSYVMKGERLVEEVTPDTQRLRDLALAATPGPWAVRSHSVEQAGGGTTITCGAWNEYGCGSTENAAYIAAASPDVTLALLDQLAARDREVSALREAAQAFVDATEDQRIWAALIDDGTGPVRLVLPGGVVDAMRNARNAVRAALAATPPASAPETCPECRHGAHDEPCYADIGGASPQPCYCDYAATPSASAERDAVVERCEKCGWDEINVRWHRNRYDCAWSQRDSDVGLGEHLHRTCRTCGYHWTSPIARAAEARDV